MRNGQNTPRVPESRLDEIFAPTAPPQAWAPDRKLEVAVVYTSVEPTIAAMRRAESLLMGLNGHIRLIDVQTVPRQFPLDSPPVSIEFSKRRLLAIADKVNTETSAFVFLCRQPFQTLQSVLKPGSVVLLGRRRTLWRTWEKRLANKLRGAGYDTVLVRTA
jgi:hypothetical protein